MFFRSYILHLLNFDISARAKTGYQMRRGKRSRWKPQPDECHMRITLVSPSLRGGGAERAMSLLASCWAEQGRQVTLLTFERANACSSSCRIHASVKIKKLGLESVSSHVVDAILRNLWRLYILRRAIQESEADIVVSF